MELGWSLVFTWVGYWDDKNFMEFHGCKGKRRLQAELKEFHGCKGKRRLQAELKASFSFPGVGVGIP